MNSLERLETLFIQQVLAAIAEWLNENGICASVESNENNYYWVGFHHADSGWRRGASISVVDGAMRVCGFSTDRDIPLVLPDSFERLVILIKSYGNYNKDIGEFNGVRNDDDCLQIASVAS